MTFEAQPVTAGIVTLLTNAGLTVGAGDKPTGAGWQGAEGASTFVPYVIVFPTTGGYFEGSIAAPYADGRPDYVISSFGATQEQAQHTNDRAHAALVSGALSASGQTIQIASPDVEGGVVRDDDVTPHVYYSPSRWRVFTTSS